MLFIMCYACVLTIKYCSKKNLCIYVISQCGVCVSKFVKPPVNKTIMFFQTAPRYQLATCAIQKNMATIQWTLFCFLKDPSHFLKFLNHHQNLPCDAVSFLPCIYVEICSTFVRTCEIFAFIYLEVASNRDLLHSLVNSAKSSSCAKKITRQRRSGFEDTTMPLHLPICDYPLNVFEGRSLRTNDHRARDDDSRVRGELCRGRSSFRS
ncbi:unnamed protein product [Heligmosomoides polygyrus]|uniref:Secreted protein n=1 Tax=Heligmosomoides polygyrus TaxID=6339 RepID=A0A183G816_HELPZ|nr:unnamed protein product [Heligmosomoides polygyrus]